MYAQGLATIVLCEAYAMTKDENLKQVAQGALDFIEYAQGKNGGLAIQPRRAGRHDRHRLATDGVEER